VKGMQIEEVLPAPHSPWQNPFAERLIGSIRRECSQSRPCSRRTTPASNPGPLLRLLPPSAHPSRARQGRTRSPAYRAPCGGQDCGGSGSRRPAPPLPPPGRIVPSRSAKDRNHERATSALMPPTCLRLRPLPYGPSPTLTRMEPVRRLRRSAERVGRGYGEGQARQPASPSGP
jgi:hypothetical protein